MLASLGGEGASIGSPDNAHFPTTVSANPETTRLASSNASVLHRTNHLIVRGVDNFVTAVLWPVFSSSSYDEEAAEEEREQEKRKEKEEENLEEGEAA